MAQPPAPRHPAIYWVSTPTLPNETVVIAGAGLQNATVKLTDGSGRPYKSQPAFSTWERSVKFVLPLDCVPAQCNVELALQDGGTTTTVAVNRPDPWWWTGASAPVHGQWGLDTKPRSGQWLRVFGRGLAWDTRGCVPADKVDRSGQSKLTLRSSSPAVSTSSITLSATNATCFEAWFELKGVSAGNWTASIDTLWGETPLGGGGVGISISPALPTLPAHVYDVDADFGGSITGALHAAAAGPAPRTIRLNPRTYTLNTTIVVPHHTSVQGVAGLTSLEFVLPATAMKVCTAPSQACSKSINNYTSFSPGMVVKCGYQHTDGVTFEFCTPCVTAGSDSQLNSLSMVIRSAPAGTSGVWLPPGSSGFRMQSVNMTMLQANVSNAVRLGSGTQGPGTTRPVTDVEIVNSTLGQYGTCYAAGGFVQTVVLRTEVGSDLRISNNTVHWRCGWEDVDCFDRVIIEDNDIHCMTKGKITGGNSMSDYGYLGRPSSRWQSYARNHVTRPPHNDPANWKFHETWTTDGSGWITSGFADRVVPGGLVLSSKCAALILQNLPWWGGNNKLTELSSIIGSTLKVLGGPGTGQSRVVTGWEPASRKLSLESDVDGWFRAGNCSVEEPMNENVECSVIAVVASVGMKAVVGNRFEWTEVVQMFGNTLAGVVADNQLVDVNVDNSILGNGSVGAFGMCYQGPSPNWFTEFTGNNMLRSDGITLLEGLDPQPRCPAWGTHGPWVRWVTIRRNTIAGVSENSKPSGMCGAVVTNWASSLPHEPGNSTSTDIVAEQNLFICPHGATLAGDRGYVMQCPHCVVRP